jgi:cellulose synthase/poly-beta-1,6-N-acetylglucosamine synthase-like glycosyltransferase
MTKNSFFFSIIVPVKQINQYILEEIIPALKEQTYQNFELIIVPDKYSQGLRLPGWAKIIPSWPKTGPADKRDIGAGKAKGNILAFIDDDAYPDKNWLENALQVFKDNHQAAAVCGPGVTPPDDPLLARVSGWVWSTWLGAGGAGTYRCRPEAKREVDDYPTFNLLIKKKDFKTLGGFDSNYWPGEDTKLCRDLVYELNKKIVYDPSIKVYHHRRKIFSSHLKQVARYGYQRGLFAKKLPKTSNRIGYWIPSLFVLGLVIGPLFYFVFHPLYLVYIFILQVYVIGLVITSWQVLFKIKNVFVSFLTIPAIFTTHVVYGAKFMQGFLSKG